MRCPAGRVYFLYGCADSPPLGSQAATAPGCSACQIVFADNELFPAIAATKPARHGNSADADAGLSFPKGDQPSQTLTCNVRSFLFLTATICNGSPEQVILIDRDLMPSCALTDPILRMMIPVGRLSPCKRVLEIDASPWWWSVASFVFG